MPSGGGGDGCCQFRRGNKFVTIIIISAIVIAKTVIDTKTEKHWHRRPRESGTGVRCWSLLLGDGPKTPGDGLGHPVLGGPMEQITQTQRLLLTSAILSITVTINGAGLGACSACGVKAVPKATPRLTGSSSMLCFTHLPMW